MEAGENVTLQCVSPHDAAIFIIKWVRPDLQAGYVIFWQDKQIKENYQHPSFHGRVELQDPEMKDGDASVILKNININDTGTYVCSVREKNKTGKAELINTIRLTVTVSGSNCGDVEEGNQINRNPTEGNYRHHYGLGAAFVLVCLAAVGLAVGWKHKRHTEQKPEQPAAEEAVSLSQVVST